jgi:membrane protease YdiL (CAAX protease family)
MIIVASPETWQNAVHSTNAWIFMFVLVVVFPILDYVLYPRLKSTMQIYVWNILALWSLTAACIWTSRMNHLALSDLGEQTGNPCCTLVVSGIVAALFLLLIGIQKAQKKKASPEQLEKALAGVKRLMPTNSTERAVWVIVSISAGVCEELLYRGWVLNLFAAALGSVWLGWLISSILFGFGHAYQGRNAIFGTGIVGAVFGIVYVVCGSLIPGQLLHTAIDLNSGFAFRSSTNRTEA